VRHVPDGRLRRLIDEPFAVSDRDIQHAQSCARCCERAEKIANAARATHRFFDAPPLAEEPKVEARSRAALFARPSTRRALRVGRPRRWRLMGIPLSTGASAAVVGVVVAGVAAAATLTTVFAPTQVAPLPVSKADLQQLTAFIGLNDRASLGGFPTPSGSETLSFGTLSWTSSGGESQVASLADAEAATGLSLVLPTTLPNGVGSVARYVAVPKVTATVTFNSTAGPELSGSSLVATLGPAIGVSYSGTGTATNIDPLAIFTAAQPIATSTGATTSQIEQFLLSRPGVPADLAGELRLFGNPQTTLPIPTPPGATSETTQIDGSSAVVLTDNSNAASAAIWEDHNDVVRAVVGLLDKEDLLSVAQQIG
jgi:hypothetical protein